MALRKAHRAREGKMDPRGAKSAKGLKRDAKTITDSKFPTHSCFGIMAGLQIVTALPIEHNQKLFY